MVIAYDMSTAEAAYGNGTGLQGHADKAVDGNFYFFIISAVRIDMFNRFCHRRTITAVDKGYVCIGIVPGTARKSRVSSASAFL